MRLRKWLMLGALLMASAARADDGWWSTAGGIGSYGKSHPTIRMVSEDLNIRIVNEFEAKIDVAFVFRNEGKATQATMAFPEEYQDRVGGATDHFKTWVDGKPIRARRKVLNKPTKDEKEELGGDFTYQAVWLKTVNFGAGQTRKVRVTYDLGLSGDTSGSRSLSYVLTTGSTWKGPIGDCRISVTWPNLQRLSAPFPELPPAKWRYVGLGKITAQLKNWEPKHDLNLSMSTWFWNFWINGIRLPHEDHEGLYVPPIRGSASDPLFRCVSLDSFFAGAYRKNRKHPPNWGPNAERWFGGPFTVTRGVLKFASGKTVRLKRPSVFPKANEDYADRAELGEIVYLKDVVEALGGRLYYDPRMRQVRITFP